MAREFRLPDPGEGIHEAEILDVYVSTGDKVQEGAIILSIETDKAAIEVPSPFTGVVEEVRVKKGDIVLVGEVLMTFTEMPEKEAERERKRQPEEGVPRRETAKQPAKEKTARRLEEAEHRERRPEGAMDRLVPASPATRRLAREFGIALYEVPGSGPGGRVTADDVRTFAGQVKEKPEKGVERAKERSVPELPEAAETKTPKERTPERKPLPLFAGLPPLPDFSRWGPVEHMPLRSIRRATAKQMALAWSQIPHVTHQDIADITELEAFRRRHQEALEQQGGKLSLTVLVMQAVVAALKQFPRFNASVDPGAGEILLKQYYHIGIAVDTEQGLIVPVVRDVDRKSLTELAAELTELTERVRQGKATQEELRGGTFTITNPGPIGGTAFTPLINYPEVAILGLARARLEPVVHGDLEHFTIVPRLRLPLHLTFDHRVNDGADAARFLHTIIDILSDPESFILNV
jgi:pyruvate dehydrogenase E2 component (dihydrolipoamide acetyltransferase)